MSEMCGISCQNKFVKLVHLVGFIIKKNEVVALFYSSTSYTTDVYSFFLLCLFTISKTGAAGP